MSGKQSSSDTPQYPPDYDRNDATLIGKHCDIPSCHKLDFLPFKCESCKGTYCLDHRSETAHKCAFEGKWASERLRRELNSSPGSASASASAASTSSATTTTTTNSQSFFSNFLGKGTGTGTGTGNEGKSMLTESPCAKTTCKTKIHTTRNPGVFCQYCRRYYCLAHRLQDSHDCKSLKQYPLPSSSPASSNKPGTLTTSSSTTTTQHAVSEKAKAAFGRIKASLSNNNNSLFKEKKSSTSSVAELIKLKRTAQGDEKIVSEKRVYVYVEAEARSTNSKIPKGQFYYSKDWTVGKVLDSAASSLGILNMNNQADSDDTRLRIYHVEGGRILGFGEKFGDCVLTGNTVVLLRGVKIPDNVLQM